MLIKANILIRELSIRFGDEIEYTDDVLTSDGVRISESDWIDYINQAVLQILLVRPDANAILKSVALVEGTKQKIPDDGHVFIDITRNMGEDGETPGKAVYGAERETLDQMNPDWHNATVGIAIKNYMFDKKFPRSYFVSPPVSDITDVYVELVYCEIPDAVDSSSDYMPLTETFFSPIKDWALNLAFSMDADSQSNSVLGKAHEESFYRELGIDFESSVMIAPESTEGT